MNNMYWARVLICALVTSALATAQVTCSKAPYGANHSPNSAIIYDFDRDGRPDFATIEAGNLLTSYLNIGGGKFQRRQQVAISNNGNALRIAAADLNGGGNADIVIGKQFNPEIEIWFGEGNGTFTFLK